LGRAPGALRGDQARTRRCAAQGDHPGSDLSFTETYTAIVAALDRLLQANIAAGILRPDLNAEDVILALAGLWQLDPARDWSTQAQRIYGIVLGGLQRPS
jgi:hypothetical protein